MKRLVLLSFAVLLYTFGFSQGIIQKLNQINGHSSDIYCGSHFLNQLLESKQRGFLKANTQMIQDASDRSYRTSEDDSVYIIPVVFHIVYNDEEENLPDSVIYNQIELLNIMYRRKNADTVNLRDEFLPYVGDARIEFRLATIDPDGNPTNGIVRTPTDIAHFGGILPYSQGQNQEIAQWVNDSLMFNMFRLTQTEQGGSDPWDMDKYLNIWSGDLRINEPAFNVEEVFFMALATPPLTHPNWPSELAEAFTDFNQGVLVHYLNVGSNNPYEYPAPYTQFNGLVNKGKTITHEVGHYLGLRHIWGDGDCTKEDYVWDTPNANKQSMFNCNQFANTCTDDIDGIDLPDMIENYMDYSSSDCQNSFTLGQISVMREVLKDYRPDLAETVGVSVCREPYSTKTFMVYPNPSNQQVYIQKQEAHFSIRLFGSNGQVLLEKDNLQHNTTIALPYQGVFLLEVTNNGQRELYKLIRL